MKLINLNSKKGVVNLFADYILNRFNRSLNTIIEVYDFDNHFFIINGKTNSTEVLDLSKVRDEFISEYQTLLKSVGYSETINILDLIKYDVKGLKKVNTIRLDYFDSERPLYNHKILNYKFDDVILSVDYDKYKKFEVPLGFDSINLNYHPPKLQICSEFPHGYSLEMGRKLMYYGEYITYNLKNSLIVDKINLMICDEKNDEDEQVIEVSIDSVNDLSIKSLILDTFDFNFSLFNNNFENYNFSDDLTKPFNEKPWLVKDINTKDCVIL